MTKHPNASFWEKILACAMKQIIDYSMETVRALPLGSAGTHLSCYRGKPPSIWGWFYPPFFIPKEDLEQKPSPGCSSHINPHQCTTIIWDWVWAAAPSGNANNINFQKEHGCRATCPPSRRVISSNCPINLTPSTTWFQCFLSLMEMENICFFLGCGRRSSLFQIHQLHNL